MSFFGDVKPGDSGPEVSDWQSNLSVLGFPVDVTGVYDDATWSATVDFKSSQGLPANGVVDSATIEAMGQQLDKMNAQMPGGGGHPALVTMESLAIVGRVPGWGWALGLVAVVGGLYYWSK